MPSLIRAAVGAVLTLASIPFLWRGVATSGTLEVKSEVFSGTLTTTSAGFALLVGGVVLLLSARSRPGETPVAAPTSSGRVAAGIAFYLLVALIPVFLWIALVAFVQKYHPDNTHQALIAGGWCGLLLLATFDWAVPEVKSLLRRRSKP